MSTCDGTRNIRAVPRRSQRHERHTKTVVTSPLRKSWPRKSNPIYTLEGLPHPLRASLDHSPDHADRSFQACHEGVFCLGKVGRTVRTFVNDTATMMQRGIGRMRLQDSRVARWALAL